MPMRNLMMNVHQIKVTGPDLLQLLASIEKMLLGVLGVPLLLLMIAGVGSHLVQHRPVWSAGPLTPKFSKLSPMKGIERLFGKQAIANFAKGLFKIAALGTVMVAVLWPERHRLDAMVRFDPMSVMAGDQDPVVASDDDGRGHARRGWRRSISYSSTGNGSSGRRCRCRRLRKNSSSPKAIRTLRDGFGNCAMRV